MNRGTGDGVNYKGLKISIKNGDNFHLQFLNFI